MFEALVLCVAFGVEAPSSNGARTAHRLERAAAGLTVRSETDAPLRGVVAGRVSREGVTAHFVLDHFGYDPATPVRTRALGNFLAPHAARRAWHSPEEARRARRFRRLGLLLERTLREVRVFEVGTVRKDVFVLGVTDDGECVGLRTFVVET
jgi:hypothetical protein